MTLWRKLKRLLAPAPSKTSHTRLVDFQRLIAYQFRDIDLLRLSLKHRSVGGTDDVPRGSNERLEFLGDSVLGLVIADLLYRDNPTLSEGDLTKSKAMLVNETALFQVACESGWNEYIFLSPEEEKAGGRMRPSIVSDAFEAVIGAVYLDGGLGAAREIIQTNLYSRREAIIADTALHNYKGELLELVQANNGCMPRYDIVSETGPDHHKSFRVVVNVAGKTVGEGVGASKKEAEQKAAAEALEALKVGRP